MWRIFQWHLARRRFIRQQRVVKNLAKREAPRGVQNAAWKDLVCCLNEVERLERTP